VEAKDSQYLLGGWHPFSAKAGLPLQLFGFCLAISNAQAFDQSAWVLNLLGGLVELVEEHDRCVAWVVLES
jgi:hypothetical protein